jgi:hypothetical protein
MIQSKSLLWLYKRKKEFVMNAISFKKHSVVDFTTIREVHTHAHTP